MKVYDFQERLNFPRGGRRGEVDVRKRKRSTHSCDCTRALETQREAEKLDTRAYSMPVRILSWNQIYGLTSIDLWIILLLVNIDNIVDNKRKRKSDRWKSGWKWRIRVGSIDRGESGVSTRGRARSAYRAEPSSKSGPKFLKLSPTRPVARLSIRARSLRKSWLGVQISRGTRVCEAAMREVTSAVYAVSPRIRLRAP